MPLIVLSYKITDSVTPHFSKRHLSTAAKETNRFAGETWHSDFLPWRFHGATQARYILEPRTEIYRRIIKPKTGRGEGRFAMLQKTGKSFRFARYFSRITATQYQATVKVNVPSYFASPKIGTIYEDGKRKTITRQPNKKREVQNTTREEIRQLDQRSTDRYATYFGRGERAPRTTRSRRIT